MKYYAGLDVSLDWTSVCIVDEVGRVVREWTVPSESQALVNFLIGTGKPFARIGLEAGALSEWLYAGLVAVELPVVCLETRRVKSALSAMVVKTDRNDAQGIAQITRTGWFRPVHVKTAKCQELRTLLTARKLLVNQVVAIGQSIRGLLRPFGLKVGRTSSRNFEQRVIELLAEQPCPLLIIEPLLEARGTLMRKLEVLHRQVLSAVKEDHFCRRLMTVPGVGPLTALTFRTAVDQPQRFVRSKSVGAHFGLTPRKYQSGEIDRSGRISKVGDGSVRTALFEAANVLLMRTTRWCTLKAWGMKIARRQGMKRAKVAVARKLAVILHRIWVDGTVFRWKAESKVAVS